jgi:DNA-binding Lrp family transcriptional regulator
MTLNKSISEIEQKALEIVKKSGKNGVLQSELWKMLGLDSREGSRLVLRLVKKGLVSRTQVTVNGRKTYRLFYKEKKELIPKVIISVKNIIDIPCASCPYIDVCDIGNFYDPRQCPLLEAWIETQVKES